MQNGKGVCKVPHVSIQSTHLATQASSMPAPGKMEVPCTRWSHSHARLEVLRGQLNLPKKGKEF